MSEIIMQYFSIRMVPNKLLFIASVTQLFPSWVTKCKDAYGYLGKRTQG